MTDNCATFNRPICAFVPGHRKLFTLGILFFRVLSFIHSLNLNKEYIVTSSTRDLDTLLWPFIHLVRTVDRTKKVICSVRPVLDKTNVLYTHLTKNNSFKCSRLNGKFVHRKLTNNIRSMMTMTIEVEIVIPFFGFSMVSNIYSL